MIRALVLIKNLAEAKSRLAGILDPEQRGRLALAMATDVIAALKACPEVIAIDALVGCYGGVAACAEMGVRVHHDAAFSGASVNDLVKSWLELSRPIPGSGQLVIHADLPFLEPGDITELYKELSPKTLVIAADSHHRGTNALLFYPEQFNRFAWGEDSCKNHESLATEAGLAAVTVNLDGTACDIDTNEDLLRSAHRFLGSTSTIKATHRFFRDTELGATA